MGWRDRLRIDRILRGEETPMGDIHRMGVSEKVVDKVEVWVGAVVCNTLAPR